MLSENGLKIEKVKIYLKRLVRDVVDIRSTNIVLTRACGCVRVGSCVCMCVCVYVCGGG